MRFLNKMVFLFILGIASLNAADITQYEADQATSQFIQGQSFTATATEYITEIKVANRSSASDVLLTIFDGQKNCGASDQSEIYAEAGFSLPNTNPVGGADISASFSTMTLASPLLITNGNQYTFCINSLTGSLNIANYQASDKYAGGRLWLSATQFTLASYDMSFQVVTGAGSIETTVPGVDDASGVTIGDGNSDGTQDNLQSRVMSTQYGAGDWVTAASADVVTTVIVTQSAAPSIADFTAPLGKFAIDIYNVTANQDITVYVPYNASIDKIYKLNNDGNYYEYPSTITHFQTENKTKIVYNVLTGGPYDANPNGYIINDPIVPGWAVVAGAASNSVNAPISPLAYIVLALGILFIGLKQTRVRLL